MKPKSIGANDVSRLAGDHHELYSAFEEALRGAGYRYNINTDQWERLNMGEPTGGLARFQSFKSVLAGEIVEVVDYGCYVKNADGSSILRQYPDNMTARYSPRTGDYWVVYGDGYQSISPREAFKEGYRPQDAPTAADPTPLRIYDVNIDQFRPPTQMDIDRMDRVVSAFGALVTHLRKTGRSDAAAIAVEMAQGKLTWNDADKKYGNLREAT